MNRTIPALTGLRFFAALAVFLFHFGASWSARAHFPAPITTFLKHGYMGVSVFFILSGFILSYGYRDRLREWRDVVDFLVSRVARIYPVYLVALAIGFVFAEPFSAATGIRVLSMTQSWGGAQSATGYAWVMQAWTLSVEMGFYLCFPALFLIVRKLTGPRAAIGAAIAAALIIGFALPTIGPAAPIRQEASDALLKWPLPLLRMVEFVYGMLLCQIFATTPGLSRSLLTSPTAVIANTAAIIVLLATAVGSQALSVVAVLFGLLIYQLAARRTWLAAMLSTRSVVLLGGASYAIYLLQGPIRAWMQFAVPSPALAAALNPIVLVAFSILVYQWVEEPARRLIRRRAALLVGHGARPAERLPQSVAER